MYRGYRLFPSSTLLLSSVPCLRKRSHRQQIEIANIHISTEPSLDCSSNILSFSICLQFFSFNPDLPPSSPALLLLAVRVVVLGVALLPSIKTWQRLPIFVHTPTVASLSAFGRTALLFLIETLLVTVRYAETSGVENVGNLEVAENALNLSSTGTILRLPLGL